MLKTKWVLLACVGMAAGLLSAGQAAAQYMGPWYSLDDDPSGPLTSPPGWIPGEGAENPFGFAVPGLPLAPSPSLMPAAAPPWFWDSDILMPGGPWPGAVPMMDTPFQPWAGYVNAICDNAEVPPGLSRDLHLSFSVDRVTQGQAGTAVNWQAGLNQQPGDVFRTDVRKQHPRMFVGWPGGPGYSGPLPTVGGGINNLLLFDESWLSLTAGNGVGSQVGPNQRCPPIVQKTHDNADALDFQIVSQAPLAYFSVYPDEWMLPSGMNCADIYAVNPAAGGGPWVYAPGPTMGLKDLPQPGAWDDIDALVVWDVNSDGQCSPRFDYALFSLSPGSTSLVTPGGIVLSPADIFFTDFSGSFWLYADGALDLMLNPAIEFGDNVDALEVLLAGDANLDAIVNLSDLTIMANNWGGGGGWLQGDFNADNLINLQDLTIMANYWGTSTGTIAPVPEPAALALLALGGLALVRRRRR